MIHICFKLKTVKLGDRIEELADMLEVIKSLAKLENKDLDDIINAANQKNSKRGAFNDKIFLEKVITNNK